MIDTTGSFPVSLLANIVRLRTVSQVGQVGHEVEKPNIEQALDDRVQEILGRVAISRVFGIEGVWEVLSEISADCRTPIPARDLLNLAEKETEDSDLTSGQTTAVTQTARTKSSRLEVEVDGEKELEIVDSEAEEEGINLDDDLGEANISQMENTYASPSTGDPLPQKESPYIRSKPPESIGRTEVIIIDNMATPISELFSRRERSFGKSQPIPSLLPFRSSPQTTSANHLSPTAHTLLTTFSRTLHNLSQTHNILTLLLNTLISPNPSNHGQSSSSRLPTTPISVFAATTARPALGRLFSDLCALHLLVTAVPKTAKDAEVLYASPPDPDPDDEPQTPPQDSPAPRQEAQLEVQFAFVVEVLKDTVPDLDFWLELGLERGTYEHSRAVNSRKRKRKRNRTQRWAPFTISPDGLALQNAFGPGTAGESTSVSGQMRIGKQFPFGRRV